MAKSKNYTDEQFIEAVKNNTSIRQTLLSLNLCSEGGSYRVFHRMVKRLNIDTSHFTGMLWSKGKKLEPKRPLEDYLSNQYSISSHALRLRLIKEGVKQNVRYVSLHIGAVNLFH